MTRIRKEVADCKIDDTWKITHQHKSVPFYGRKLQSGCRPEAATAEGAMKYLCLAYGDEKDWNALTKMEQDALLAQDEVLRKRGDLVAAVQSATTVRAPNGDLSTIDGPFAKAELPLAGFSLIEARDLNEVIELVSKTPCARAGGAVEVWPLAEVKQP
jgi:hypothetical protein